MIIIFIKVTFILTYTVYILIIIIELEERREIKNEKGRKAKAIYYSMSNLRHGAMFVFMLGTFFQTPSWCIFNSEALVKKKF